MSQIHNISDYKSSLAYSEESQDRTFGGLISANHIRKIAKHLTECKAMEVYMPAIITEIGNAVDNLKSGVEIKLDGRIPEAACIDMIAKNIESLGYAVGEIDRQDLGCVKFTVNWL